ncbi:acetyltransferase-like isoleucine patch superfamily enzyme [Streptacidiphilus sp. BW17]|uniref:acyltransferase n=1 Tax=Streptacidiphilus sp. MAP5-3 TaxID=3156265 RepID=UPI00351265EF
MTRPLYGPATLAGTVQLGEYCVLGYPKESRLRRAATAGVQEPGAPVRIGDRSLLFNQIVLYEGVTVGQDCVLEDRVRIGYDSRVGDRTRLAYGAYVCDRVAIGADCTVAGFVCDAARIGDRSTVMGELVHEYTQPHKGWWAVDEEPPVIEDDCVVGYGARIVGGVRIGPCSYVAAGAVVTQDVPPEHVVTGINVRTPAAEWTGPRLQELIGHWQSLRPPSPGRPLLPVDER